MTSQNLSRRIWEGRYLLKSFWAYLCLQVQHSTKENTDLIAYLMKKVKGGGGFSSSHTPVLSPSTKQDILKGWTFEEFENFPSRRQHDL